VLGPTVVLFLIVKRREFPATTCGAALGIVVPNVAMAHFYPASLIPLWAFVSMGVVAVGCLFWRTSVLSRVTAFLLGLLAGVTATWLAARSASAVEIGFVAAFLIGTGPPLTACGAYLVWSKRLER
jgi:hypothetical protein